MKFIDKILIQRTGHIFKPDNRYPWSHTHAQVPFPYLHPEGFLRIFYATRDLESRSSVCFIDVNPERPFEILYAHDKPVLSKGEPGFFDDSGTMPSWFIKIEDRLYMYYTAWNKSKEASYRLSIGVAESYDNGVTFKKIYLGPILDRSINDLIWVGQPSILYKDKSFKMWYLSCDNIKYINGHPEPYYSVKYADSIDGIVWNRENRVCIDFELESDFNAIGRPFVFFENGVYKMFFSYRSARDYRTDPNKSYKIGFGESKDGLIWGNFKMIDFIKNEDWFSVMQEYASFININTKKYLFFNGNGFGQTGFGYAELNQMLD